ncbi:MAG TPA: radical SAM protein [bacterium]|nr:radical SAM protein [bacterium]
MKISLIEPEAADYHIYSKYSFPRLGLPLLATVLARQGHDVQFYCDCVARRSAADFRDILRSDLVGISITTSTAPGGYRLGRALKLARIPVVFGGSHATYCPDEALRYGDYVIRGEGEFALPELAEALAAGASPAGIKNLSHRVDGDTVHEPLRPLLEKLDGLPWPDFSLMKGARRMKVYPLAAGRGCPRHCDFCAVTPLFGHKIRTRSAKDVVAEVRRVSQRHIFFVDDNFTANRRYVREVVEGLARLKGAPRWMAQAGVDVGRDEELVKLMRRAGCDSLAIGFESINNETLAGFRKGQTRDDIVRCIETLRKHNIWIHGMFMFGGEADGPETAAETVAFAKKHEIDSAQFVALTPLPGTDLHERLEREGRIFSHDWSLYDGHHVVIEPARMTPLELQMGLIKAHREFYSWARVLREIRRFHWFAAAVTYYGHNLVRKWQRRKGELLQLLERRTRGRRPARPVAAVGQEAPSSR